MLNPRLLHDGVGHLARGHVARNGLIAPPVRPDFVRARAVAQQPIASRLQLFDDLVVAAVHVAQRAP